MKKVLLGLVILMTAGNAYALNENCRAIDEVQPGMNQVHDYMINFRSFDLKERSDKFNDLSEMANKLYSEVRLCDDAYTVNLAEQMLEAVSEIGQENARIFSAI